jgi:hypothetical protein
MFFELCGSGCFDEGGEIIGGDDGADCATMTGGGGAGGFQCVEYADK